MFDSIPPLAWLVALLFILAFVNSSFKGRRGKRRHSRVPQPTGEPRSQGVRYRVAKSLFSPAERSFFGVLKMVVRDQYDIMAKVRMGDVLEPEKGMDAGTWQTAWNKVNSKHIDFVLCDPSDYSVLAAIELDDSSHSRHDRQARDEFVDMAFEAVGIPVFHARTRHSYSPEELAGELRAFLPLDPSDQPFEHNSDSSVPKTPEAAEPGVNTAPVETGPRASRTCPTCGAEMILRTAKRGKNAGDSFWGCSSYPKCRTTMPVDGIQN